MKLKRMTKWGVFELLNCYLSFRYRVFQLDSEQNEVIFEKNDTKVFGWAFFVRERLLIEGGGWHGGPLPKIGNVEGKKRRSQP